MAATARVIWLCACVRYWAYRGVGTCASVHNLVVTMFLTGILSKNLSNNRIRYQVFLRIFAGMTKMTGMTLVTGMTRVTTCRMTGMTMVIRMTRMTGMIRLIVTKMTGITGMIGVTGMTRMTWMTRTTWMTGMTRVTGIAGIIVDWGV